jgi:hypothetical protein
MALDESVELGLAVETAGVKAFYCEMVADGTEFLPLAVLDLPGMRVEHDSLDVVVWQRGLRAIVEI